MEFLPDDAFFAGHFPGRPILPGVTQIALVVAAARREHSLAALSAIPRVRLRQLVEPGERLNLAIRSSNEGLARFELRRNGQMVANGELAFGTPRPAWESEPPHLESTVRHPPVERLLPHRPPMLFVRRVLALNEAEVIAEVVLPEDCPLAEAGVAPAIAAVEAAAQAAAIGEALRQHDEGRARVGPRIGYLVSLRDVELTEARLPVARPFVVCARLASRVLPLSTYAIEAFVDGKPLLRGEIGTFLAPDA